MEPEFAKGDVIIVEPSVLVEDGCYVVALYNGEYFFRQLRIESNRWFLKPLNQQYETQEIPGVSAIKGRIISKTNGRGRHRKNYL